MNLLIVLQLVSHYLIAQELQIWLADYGDKNDEGITDSLYLWSLECANIFFR